MAVRDTLLANLAVSLVGSSISTSNELPFVAGGVSLFDKNMKRLYLDYDQSFLTELINTLTPTTDVPQTEILVNGYFTVDAKNQPIDIDNVIGRIQNARLSVANTFIRECSITNAFDDDRITYTIEYRFVTI